jgi:hypothetical protein
MIEEIAGDAGHGYFSRSDGQAGQAVGNKKGLALENKTCT